MADQKVPDQRVYQQIEQAADYYGPSVYDALSKYDRFGTESDSVADGYIPISPVSLSEGANPKRFVIGLLPPATAPTRLLDRSVTTFRGDEQASISLPGTDRMILPVDTFQCSGAFYQAKEPGQKSHNGVDFGAPAGTPLSAVASGTVVSVTREGDPNNKNTLGGTTITLAFTKDGVSYTAYYAHLQDTSLKKGDQVSIGDTVGLVGNTGNAKHTGSHCHFELKANGKYVDPLRYLCSSEEAFGGAVRSDVQPSGTWAQGGSDAAASATDRISSTAGTSLPTSKLAGTLLSAQTAMIEQTNLLLDQMANTPPLRMLVNPSSFKVSCEKVVSDGSYGRYGPIVEHWGDAQDKIEGSGKVAAFYAVDGVGGVGPGLTRMARNASESFQNFLSLYLIYRNNGALWVDAGIEVQGRAVPSLSVVGSVYLYYDNTLYIGAFDSFTISETDEKPFSVEYSFSFTVRATFLLDNVDPVMIAGRQANPMSNPSLWTSQPSPQGDPTMSPSELEDALIKGYESQAGATDNIIDQGQAAGAAYDAQRAFERTLLSGHNAVTPPKRGKGSR